MKSPHKSHQVSWVWLQGWKSCPFPDSPVDHVAPSTLTLSPTSRTAWVGLGLSGALTCRGVRGAAGGRVAGAASSIRSFRLRSFSSISSHFDILFPEHRLARHLATHCLTLKLHVVLWHRLAMYEHMSTS